MKGHYFLFCLFSSKFYMSEVINSTLIEISLLCWKPWKTLLQVKDWTPESGKVLKEISAKYNFLLMEDRKFFDIGNTVKQQVRRSNFIKHKK